MNEAHAASLLYVHPHPTAARRAATLASSGCEMHMGARTSLKPLQRRFRRIGQKVCLDRTHVPLMLIQPEREWVFAVELFPDSPVTPFRPPIASLRG